MIYYIGRLTSRMTAQGVGTCNWLGLVESGMQQGMNRRIGL